jgi:D-alanyl-D-alanine carboxypeptidase
MYKILLYYFFAFIILLITGCVGNNNNNQTTNTNSFTHSASTVSPDLNNVLQSFVESYAKNNYFSAISATVRCGNSQVSGVAGTLESAGATLIDTNSLFQIGSTSKSFTSVVILQLADDQKYKFSLNDSIGKWFKNLDGSPKYPQWQNVTIIQLMNMSSGIPDYVNDTFAIIEKSLLDPNHYFSPTELVTTVESMPILFAPGQGYHYSNTNYILLGMLIQKITGNTPATEIQNRIFTKLNLTHTYFPENLPSSIVPINQMTNGYAYFDFFPDSLKYLNGFYNRTWSSLSLEYTAGGIISTSEDLTTYTQALYNPGFLLTKNEIENLTTKYMIAQSPTSGFPNGGQPITEVSESIPVGYGLGIFKIYAPEPLGSYYMYNGATLGYSSFYAYYPKNEMYTTFMINNGVNMTIQNKAYQNLINEITQYTITTQCKNESSIE